MNLDRFLHDQHKEKKPGYAQALRLTSSHRHVISYKAPLAILRREGLELGRNEFYNLERQEGKGRLSKQEEIQPLIAYLEENNFHVQVRTEYILDDSGNRASSRVVKDIFFINQEQIQLGCRLASGFTCETDATFIMNIIRMPLSVMVGITNVGKTFPLAYCYITSESALPFKFVASQLTKYIF
jgi:hypothetical protein